MLTRLTQRRRGRDWLTLPLHPIGVAAFPVLFLFAENAVQQVTLDPLWKPLGLSVAGSIVVLLACVALLRDWRRGGLLAVLAIGLFFSFGHVWNVVGDGLPGRGTLVAAYGVVALAGAVAAWHGGRWVAPATGFLNLAAVLLVAFNLVRVVDFALGGSHAVATNTPGLSAAVQDGRGRPDIYYIILDRYANVETLDRIYDYDNRPFLKELERRGFSVAQESWANYFKTALSVYSTLTMEYLDAEALRNGDPPTFEPLHGGLQESLPVPSTLKALGYEYVHIGSWWEPTSTNEDADRVLVYEENSEFTAALLSTTAWMLTEPPTPRDEDPETIEHADLARRNTIFGFDRLEETGRRPGPTYVFAHILTPHPPYVFNADGSLPSEQQHKERSDEEEYVEQLKWTNRRVLAAIDRLLDVPNGEQPIILLQADEGPFPRGFVKDQKGFNWLEEATPNDIQRKYGILSAYHLPGVDPADYGFTDRISPVNSFRIIFDAFFGTDLPILADRVYLSPDYDHYLDFVEYDPPKDR